MEKRRIKKTNYLILVLIFLVTFIAIFLLRRVYLNYKDYNLKRSLLVGVVEEIKAVELNNYIGDKADVVLYLGNADEESKTLEKKLLKDLKDNHLEEQLIFMDLKTDEEKEEFIKDFNQNNEDNSKFQIKKLPALVIYINREIVSVVSKEENKTLEYSSFQKEFDLYELLQK